MDQREPTTAGTGKPNETLAESIRLLGGGPVDFGHAVKIIEQRARFGDCDVLCLLASLEANGAGRRPDLGRALAHLRRAAELGSVRAREQRELLTTRGANPDQWLNVPDSEVLAQQPRIRVARAFASPAECRWIVNRLGHKVAPAMVWDTRSGTSRVDPARTNYAVELQIADLDVVIAAVRARIAAVTRLPLPVFERPQVLRYAAGQQFRPHHDFLDPEQRGQAEDIARSGQRIATFLLYLNNDYGGGETTFPTAGLSFRGGTGDALFFANVLPNGACDPLTLHAGLPPVSGEKWVFSQWIRDRTPTAGEAS